MAYATDNDLAGYVTTVPATWAILLDRCSRDVDQALLCAVYDPTDAGVQATLTAATCEQAAGYIDEGKLAGLAGGISQFRLGSLSVTRAQAGTREVPRMIGRLYEQAFNVLQQAGLTGLGPQDPTT